MISKNVVDALAALKTIVNGVAMLPMTLTAIITEKKTLQVMISKDTGTHREDLHDNRINVVDVTFAVELKTKPECQRVTGVHSKEYEAKLEAHEYRHTSASVSGFYNPFSIFLG
jgi:hypothetical protein